MHKGVNPIILHSKAEFYNCPVLKICIYSAASPVGTNIFFESRIDCDKLNSRIDNWINKSSPVGKRPNFTTDKGKKEKVFKFLGKLEVNR